MRLSKQTDRVTDLQADFFHRKLKVEAEKKNEKERNLKKKNLYENQVNRSRGRQQVELDS